MKIVEQQKKKEICSGNLSRKQTEARGLDVLTTSLNMLDDLSFLSAGK